MEGSAENPGSTGATRHDAVVGWLDRFDPHAEDWDAKLSPVVMAVVDLALEGDADGLQELADPVRDALARLFEDAAHAREARGYMLGLLAMIRWALQRLPDPAAGQVAHGTHAWKLLMALSREPRLSSSELRERLATSESQLSRTGRQLLAAGLVFQRRAGRAALWELTPRGRQLLRTGDGDGGRHAGAR